LLMKLGHGWTIYQLVSLVIWLSLRMQDELSRLPWLLKNLPELAKRFTYNKTIYFEG
jgi:hypothetical protein